jgi:hypothetical protein
MISCAHRQPPQDAASSIGRLLLACLKVASQRFASHCLHLGPDDLPQKAQGGRSIPIGQDHLEILLFSLVQYDRYFGHCSASVFFSRLTRTGGVAHSSMMISGSITSSLVIEWATRLYF